MSTKNERMQRFILYWKEHTGETEVDMGKVADMALEMGWGPPKPPTSRDMLARQFKQAARAEIRHDEVTGQPYRAYHAIPKGRKSNGQLTFTWVDIDEARRSQMQVSLTMRREQMVNDGVQLRLDNEHWIRTHPDEEPIQLEFDLAPDIEWRLNSPREDEAT